MADNNTIEEFVCVWFEQCQKWLVLLPDGRVIDRGFKSDTSAYFAALDALGRKAEEFTGNYDAKGFNRYTRDDKCGSFRRPES